MSQLLKTFNDKGIGTELQLEVREIERRDAQQLAANKTLATELRELFGRLSSTARTPWQKRLVEVLKALDEAPDAVRDRFAAWQKAKTRSVVERRGPVRAGDVGLRRRARTPPSPNWPAPTPSGRHATLVGYLTGVEPSERSIQAASLEGLSWPGLPGTPDMIRRLELLTRIVQLMPPPRHDSAEVAEKTMLHRVLEDENAAPTEYAVRLPPEYHPLRSYPAVIVLHSGQSPSGAIDEWAAEAARHGYILIAPEYNLPGQAHDYRYTTSEHAAVELALRDARKRYAIDSDRVFVAGQLTGGNMAWDYGLAHPDLFAGVVVFSGFPAKYVPKYLPHHERLPLFYVIGELAPAANELIFSKYIKPKILKGLDVTYIEYQRAVWSRSPRRSLGRSTGWTGTDAIPIRSRSQPSLPAHPTTGSTASSSASSRRATPRRPRRPTSSGRISIPPRSG